MSEHTPQIVDLQAFLAGPNLPTNQSPNIGKQWHPIVEALLFASPNPLTLEELNTILDNPGKPMVHQVLMDIQQSWQEERRGIELIELAVGWQLRTKPETAEYVSKLFEIKPKRLSKAAMEALAVIAYRQPVTRAEVEQIRGVDSNAVIHKLAQLNFVEVVGRKEDDPGKPEMLGTTKEFLSHFGIKDLLDLPTLQAVQIQTLPVVPEMVDPLAALQIHLNLEQ